MLPGVLESSQDFIECVASTDQWSYVYTFLAQSAQCGGEWTTARALHTNLVYHNGSQVQATLICNSAF